MAHVRRVLREAWRTVRQASPPTVLSSFSRHAKLIDEWSYLQRPGPALTRLAAAETEAARATFAAAKGFRERLEAEAASLLVADNVASELQGPFTYYQRHSPEGFLLFCRMPVGSDQVEEVLLDTAKLAEGESYADVTACKVSDDHSLLAYIVDLHGDDTFELRLRRLDKDSQAAKEARFPDIRSVEFLQHRSDLGEVSLLAVQVDPTSKRAYQALHLTVHATGDQSCKTLWEETDAAAYLELYRTKDRAYILVSSNTKDTSEVRLAKCGRLEGDNLVLKPLLAKTSGVEYFAEHRDGWLYVVSNHERPDFMVYRASVDEIERTEGAWSCLEPVFTPPGKFHVTDADLLSRWLVLYGHEAAAPRICVVSLSEDRRLSGNLHSYLVNLPEIGSVEPGINAEANADLIQYTFRSPVEPGCTFELDLASGHPKIVSRCTVNHPELLQSLQCERVEFPSRDGTIIPITLVRQSSHAAGNPGMLPCLLQVYGSYGTCFSPDFRSEHIALLRRGWALAWAHVRGGGENGREWHQSGRQFKKQNSVLDLVDAMKYLLAHGIATPGCLCLKGSSAGGLTVGTLLNSHADAVLVGAAILEVPFVDTLTSMMDSTLPLTVHEFEEWGDPQDIEHEANIRSLSPFENLGSHRYPPVYISCASNDARAPVWMSLKYAARMRARSSGLLDRRGSRRRSSDGGSGDNVVVYCSDSGHAGPVSWQERDEEFSRQVSFLHNALGLEKI
ncbi:ptrB [Symbiodinium sp. CCMP2456]|nr:ptrB [Symbiodinium sp. CCMP2456]